MNTNMVDAPDKTINRHTASSYAERHQALNQAVNEAFENGDLSVLRHLGDTYLPALTTSVQLENSEPERENSSNNECMEITHQGISLKATREGGIRLFRNGVQLTTDRNNIPNTYPWFYDDPTDSQRIGGFAERHVGRGIRFLDPWNECDWPQVGGIQQGLQNWPPKEAAFGPCNLDMHHHGNNIAIRADYTSGQLQPNAYGCIPRGLFTLNTTTNQILLACQQQNMHPDLHWAAWFVLGFALPESGPSYTQPASLFAFPDSSLEAANSTLKVSRLWNTVDVNGQRFSVIHPHVKTINEPFKDIYSDVNWSVLAHRGEDYVIIIRSLLRHPEQFFPFLEHGNILREENGTIQRCGGFLEAEHTGPKVAHGQKSACLVAIDIVDLNQLIGETMTRFSTTFDRFQDEFVSVLNRIRQCEQIQQLNVPSETCND